MRFGFNPDVPPCLSFRVRQQLSSLRFVAEPPYHDAHQEHVVFSYGALLAGSISGERCVVGAVLAALVHERHRFLHGRNHGGEMDG